jgi:arabinofuranan 3-O-arabinosyltransferase
MLLTEEPLEESETSVEPRPAGRIRSISSVSPTSRWTLLAIGAGFLVATFLQAPGKIEDDTKLPLIATPYAYIDSALHLWNQNVFGGTVELGTGFLMPMGFFFAITHFLHIPTWCAERLWLTLLLTVACWGVVRLCEALGIGRRWTRVLAGLAYCAAPIVLGLIMTSDFLLAVVFLPWVVVPLVTGSREGSPRRAAARSGVAIALMGGSNAVVVLAVLPMAVIWLITRKPGPRRRALIGWWLVAGGLACFWWVVATVFVGKYGYNYLPYTETSAITTHTSSLFESLRGASNWLDYFDLGGPYFPGAWLIVSSAAVIVATTIVSALGLAGLCRRIPERLFLITTLTFGVIVIAAGFSGPSGGLFSGTVQHLLQDELEPFRNISKFAPLVALPLALGLAWVLAIPLPWRAAQHRLKRLAPGTNVYAVALAVVALRPVRRRFGHLWPRPRVFAIVAAVLVALVAVGSVFVAAAPYWEGDLYRTGGFSAIPSYWSQAGAWLDAHQGHENALVVPGASFSYDTWGNPIDEPIQDYTDTSVEWRNLIPIGSNGYTQMLDTVEQAIDNGTSPPGLAQFLSREGIKYVVERNDLDLVTTGAPPPAQVHEVLSETSGLTPVASFGSLLPARQIEFGSLPVYDSKADLHLRPVEIFRVDQADSVVQTYPVTDPVVVSGNVQSLLPLAGAGVIAGRVSTLSGDPKAKGVAQAPQATAAITDGNQRRTAAFGQIRNDESYLLGARQSLPGAPAGVPSAFTVVPGVRHQTVEDPIGAASVSASSFGSLVLVDEPTEGPASAFDPESNAAWVADAANHSLGQWISITFLHKLKLSTITLTPLSGSALQPKISQIRITTDRGSVRRELPDRSGPVKLSVPTGLSLHLKITITGVRPLPAINSGGVELGAGISHIAIPGLRFQDQMKVPTDVSNRFASRAANTPVVVFSRPIANANLSLGLVATDDPDMARAFVLPKAMSAQITGYAVPAPGTALDNILTFLSPKPSSGLSVTASSWLSDLPKFRPENLIDNSTQPWIAALGDKEPSIDLRWTVPRTIDAISLELSSTASRPTEIAITGSTGAPQVVRVPQKGGLISFAPLRTDSLHIQFIRSVAKFSVTPDYGFPLPVPVGLQRISVPGLESAAVAPANPLTTFDLPCGDGPPVTIDGKTVPTSISGTLAELTDLQPIRFAACTNDFGGLALAAGSHGFEAKSTLAPFVITSAVLRSGRASPATSASGARKATIEQWSADARTLKVTAGPATYLAVAQNYNSGWSASLGGQSLKPVRIDGWQQGFIVPAGRAGTVTLSMSSDSLFRGLLLIGGLFLVLLLALALLPSKKVTEDPGGERSPPSVWILLGGAALALLIVAGPLALVVVPLAFMARRWGSGAMTLTAFVAFVVAGVFAALTPAMLLSQTAGAFGRPAQIASAIALGALLCSLVPGRRDRRDQPEIDHGHHPALTTTGDGGDGGGGADDAPLQP